MERQLAINNLKPIKTYSVLRKLTAYVDLRLLVFLLLFLNVKLAIKIPVIVLCYLSEPNINFGFKIKDSRLPIFYLVMLIIPFISIIINGTPLTGNYPIVLTTGICFWLICILAVHQVKLAVEKNEPEILNQTLIVFFALNAIVSAFNLFHIILDTGAINPYTYQGEYQKYFIGTGDYIKGLTFDTSTTNAVLNALGALYFLTKKNVAMLIVCTAVILFTGSNFTNLTFIFVLSLLFLFKSTRDQKSLIAICLTMLVVFMVKVSPQNNQYVLQTFSNIIHRNKIMALRPDIGETPVWQRPDNVLNLNQKREKAAKLYLDSIGALNDITKDITKTQQSKNWLINNEGRILIPKPDINSAPYQSNTVTPPEQHHLVTFINKNKADLPISSKRKNYPALPGKIIGMVQTAKFIKEHPSKMLAGIGMANFSSKLAFKASGLNISGGYPAKYVYMNTAFKTNHLDLYLNFFSKRSGYHSLTNSPFSVYDQLLAEYGLLGLVAFFIGYLGFFWKHHQALTYGLPVLVFICLVLFIDYWFEQLSILIMFELMLFMDIKEQSLKLTTSHAK